jgi:hypothetical protein
VVKKKNITVSKSSNSKQLKKLTLPFEAVKKINKCYAAKNFKNKILKTKAFIPNCWLDVFLSQFLG